MLGVLELAPNLQRKLHNWWRVCWQRVELLVARTLGAVNRSDNCGGWAETE